MRGHIKSSRTTTQPFKTIFFVSWCRFLVVSSVKQGCWIEWSLRSPESLFTTVLPLHAYNQHTCELDFALFPSKTVNSHCQQNALCHWYQTQARSQVSWTRVLSDSAVLPQNLACNIASWHLPFLIYLQQETIFTFFSTYPLIYRVQTIMAFKTQIKNLDHTQNLWSHLFGSEPGYNKHCPKKYST